MANCFGIVSAVPDQFTVKLPLFDSALVRQDRDRFIRPAIPALGYANSFYLTAGRWPARGWILLQRKDYDKLSTYVSTITPRRYALQLDDLINQPRTFVNLAIVQARCVSRGFASDPDAIYLVELTDQRGVLWNKWFQYPLPIPLPGSSSSSSASSDSGSAQTLTQSQFNVRSPAYPEQYYAGSLNSGTTWTWPQLIANLWNQMSPFIGAFPGVPSTPTETPESWIFPGMSCWEALSQALEYQGWGVAANLSRNLSYTIVDTGAADSAFANLTSLYAKLLEEDLEYIDTGDGRVPGRVVVYFHRRNQYYGTEETVRRDGLQWTTTPLYAVTVTSPSPFNRASGTHYLWSERTVRFTVDGVPLPADVAAAEAQAQREVTNYFQRIYRATLGYMNRTYTGVLPFVTGSQVDGVRYYQTYEQGRASWRTQVIRGPWPPWPEVNVAIDE